MGKVRKGIPAGVPGLAGLGKEMIPAGAAHFNKANGLSSR
jgi:hypothetical protein